MKISGFNKFLLSILILLTVSFTTKANKRNAANSNRKITICHIPPGNPNNPQTISISESAWPAHAAHGDSKGECDSNDGDDHNGGNDGDHDGGDDGDHHDGDGCNGNNHNDNKITICHIPPGNPNNPQTITISKNAWPAHENHGDSKGRCNSNDGDDHNGGGNDGGHNGGDDDDHNGGDGDDDHNGGDGDDDHNGGDGDDDHNGGNDDGNQCLSEVSAAFTENNLTVTATSTKDLSNVVLNFYDGTTQKFDNLSGTSLTLLGNEEYTGKCIVGVWIKSGCNLSGDGPGYGEYVENLGWNGTCVSLLTEKVSPVLECVEFKGNNSYIAHFGYLNENEINVEIPVGDENKFTPSPIDRGQSTNFLTGRQVDTYQVAFNGTNLVWTLTSPNGSTRTSTASDNPAQRCESDKCLPQSITGGGIAFNGPYNPTGTNTIVSTALPTSPFAQLGFEYVWLQSEVNVPNTPNNGSWSLIDGSENLTELSITGLTQTMYYIRCARLVGCDMYWGETNTVEVTVDPCPAGNITGGSIAFNGPYNPTGTNTIVSTALPTSPFAELGFEYVWLQNTVNVVNNGNSGWSLIEGSQNLTEIQVSGLTQTMYYLRCARLVGCNKYWGETNIVEVTVDPCPVGNITGGSIAFNGPYDPNGSNTIVSTALPTSPFAELGFEYVWLQSEVNVPNTPNNGSWSLIDGSENLTELSIAGLTQTMYYIRCARLVGCEMYWGETNTVTVTVDPCPAGNITGGSIAFNGPYNPNGTNTIVSTALPTSPFAELGFEYVWLQSEVNVPNTPNNGSWSLIDGSENLTELSISGLTQTMYYIRCARLVGCEMYWGETNTVTVTVDPCPAGNITGGSIAFNGPYNPNGTNTIVSTALPTSPFAELGYEYVWLQSEVNVPNTPNNGSWSLIEGSANLTELNISGLTQTMYYIRCARLVGCQMYWGETNTVEVSVVHELPTASIFGSGQTCSDQMATISIVLTGTSPFIVTYSNGTDNTTVETPEYIYSFEALEGAYQLVSVTDAYNSGTVEGEAIITKFDIPTATLSGDGQICGDALATINVALTGTAPFNLTYTDGVSNTEVLVDGNEYSFEAPAGSFSLVSVSDANCQGTVEGEAIVTNFNIPTATLGGGGQVCADELATINVTLTGTVPFNLTYTDGVSNIEVLVDGNEYSFEAPVGSFSLVSVSDANCQGTIEGVALIESFEKPTATISGTSNICANELGIANIDLTGNGPWTVVYSDGINETQLLVEDNTHQLELAGGTYELVSVSDLNCTGVVSGQAIISNSASPTAFISTEGAVCDNQLGTISIALTGVGPWNIEYTDGSNVSQVTSSASAYTFTANSGTYELISVSDQQCTGTVSGTAAIANFEKPTAVISGGGAVCNEQATLRIDFTGQGPWTFTYMVGKIKTTNTSTESVYEFKSSQLGQYNLISVSDANCTGTVSGTGLVESYPAPTGKIYLATGNYCLGEEIVLQNDISESGNTFSWSTSGTGNLLNADTKLASYVAIEEESSVEFVLTVSNGCNNFKFIATASFIGVNAEFSITPKPEGGNLISNIEYTFEASDLNATTYLWDFGDGTGASSSSTSHTFVSVGNYEITLLTTKGNCSDEANELISVIDNQNLFIPNVFSPTSSNPENSVLKVYGENLAEEGFEFSIYNRWGQVVYQTKNLDKALKEGWNGQTNGNEKENNVFSYTIRGKFKTGKVFEKTGTVTLVK